MENKRCGLKSAQNRMPSTGTQDQPIISAGHLNTPRSRQNAKEIAANSNSRKELAKFLDPQVNRRLRLLKASATAKS